MSFVSQLYGKRLQAYKQQREGQKVGDGVGKKRGRVNTYMRNRTKESQSQDTGRRELSEVTQTVGFTERCHP